jgi:hypothetical protein
VLPEDMSVEDQATNAAMNGSLPSTPVNGYIPAPPPSVTITTTTTPSTPAPAKNGSAPTAAPAAASQTEFTGDYNAYVLNVQAPWPPPVFARPKMQPQERFYMENRWYSQWSFFDKKANESKKRYLQLQQIIVIGSVIVPVLVAFGPNLAAQIPDGGFISDTFMRFIVDIATVIISTAVAVAAAWEGLHKNGDSWSTYRRAAEEMQQEKFMFDVRAGRYANEPNPYIKFVERCEEVIAQQNGRFIQTIEKQQAQQQAQNEKILADINKDDDDDDATTVTVRSHASSPSVVSVEATPVAPPAPVEETSAG